MVCIIYLELNFQALSIYLFQFKRVNYRYSKEIYVHLL